MSDLKLGDQIGPKVVSEKPWSDRRQREPSKLVPMQVPLLSNTVCLRIILLLVASGLTCLSALNCRAQATTSFPSSAPAASPTPTSKAGEQQETVRVFTEEVRLPIFAYDDYGHFDPTLERDDILVLEDGVPQEVRSVQHIPAGILLLLCTSGDANPAMRTNMTRDIALNLISNLRAGDQISLFQFTSRVELLQDWTNDKALVERVLRSKLHSGRGTRLAPAIARAAFELQKQPFGNRHLVIIGDGVDVPAWADYHEMMKALAPDEATSQAAHAAMTQAIRELIAAQATVHVISYQQLATEIFDGKQQKNSRNTPNDSIRFDPAMHRLHKAYQKAMEKSEERLTGLVQETGGRLLLATSNEEMIAEGNEVARDIGAQYIITYRPKRPLASAPKDEYRNLTVAARRVGLHLRTRRGYVVTSSP
jgi:VWFA-related protein